MTEVVRGWFLWIAGSYHTGHYMDADGKYGSTMQYQEESAQNTLLKLCDSVARKTIAKILGVTIGTVNRWAAGSRQISSPEHALRIAQISGNLADFKKLYPDATEINNIVEHYEVLTGSTQIKIAMIKQSSNLLALPSQLHALPKISKDNPLPIIVDKYGHLVAFPERVQACKAASRNTVPAFVVDIEQHLNNKIPIIPIIEHCSCSEKGLAALALQDVYAKTAGRPSKNKKMLENSPKFKTYNMTEIIHCVGLSNYKAFQTIINVLKQGSANLIKLMDERKLALSVAHKIVQFPQATQHELITLDKEMLRKALKEIQHTSKSFSEKKQTAINKPISQQENKTVVITMDRDNSDIPGFHALLQEHDIKFTCIEQASTFVWTLHRNHASHHHKEP